MADATYQPKVYRAQGSTSYVVASGGSIEAESGAEVNVQSGALFTLAGSTFVNTSGQFVTPSETLTTAGAISAAYPLTYLNCSTSIVKFKMPTPAKGLVKYIVTVGAATQLTVESSAAVWTSTGSNRINLTVDSGALFVGWSSTSWKLINTHTSTAGGILIVPDLSTST